jgi:SpoVK/Ycf46/Vps4 family AAA+-type ATPase
MTAARHLISLLKSHINGDDEHFLSVAMQVAAHEARQGHGKLAQELRDLVDDARLRRKERGRKPVPLAQPKGELANLVSVSYSDTRLSSMVLPEDLEERLKRVLMEQRQQHRLRSHGLVPRRKLLLLGPPGSGKTMTAAALAGELRLPLFTVVFDSLISKFMGETASKLRVVFDAMNETRGVYFFDEFDAIGSRRGERNDVGEIRRVLNSFLQLLEKDESDGFIIAATNYPELLDPALFRRFDDVIRYGLPNRQIAVRLVKNRLVSFDTERIDWESIAKSAEGMSQSELAHAGDEAAKRAVLAERSLIIQEDLNAAIAERKGPAYP